VLSRAVLPRHHPSLREVLQSPPGIDPRMTVEHPVLRIAGVPNSISMTKIRMVLLGFPRSRRRPASSRRYREVSLLRE
jgi:hypothetical protein